MIANSSKCPPHIVLSLQNYQHHRLRTGSFLRAVLCNDLLGAISHADEESLDNLRHIVAYVYNEMPSGVWGSPQKVDNHLFSKKAEEAGEDE